MDEEIVVYLYGCELGTDVWYRVVLETSPVLSKGKSRRSRRREKEKREKKKQIISPAAVFPVDDLRINGGWTVIDDDIYWAGGWICSNEGKITVSKDLLKHNTHHPDPSNWEIVSSLNIPRASPFLAAVGRKLAVVAGEDYRIDDKDNNDSNKWRNCGEIYDLDNQTWDYLSSDIKHFDPYPTYYHATTVVEDQEPIQVVFYSLVQGSMLILDASTGSIVEYGNPDHNFALRSPPDHLPPGLELERCESILPLSIAVDSSTAVFHKRTFYYFTYELRLYGYDVDLRRWFLSECLANQLHPVKPKPVDRDPPVSLLLGLPNGNLLLLVPQERGEFRMASLSVRKDDATSTLDVTVERTQYFHPHNPRFSPLDGKAIRLKNTGSGTMQG